MLKKIVILVLVIGILGVLAAVVMPRGSDSDGGSATTEQGTTGTTDPSGGSVSGSVIQIPSSRTVVYDFRTKGFDTLMEGNTLYVQLELEPNQTYYIDWFCNSTLPPVLSSYGAFYQFSYSLDDVHDASENWTPFDDGLKSGQALSSSFTTGDTGMIYFYLFESSDATDLDSIYVHGRLLENFKFVISQD